MPGFISASPLARGLIRIGDEAIVRADDAKLRDYFAADYVFHGPGGDLGFEELRAYFASLRAAFSSLRIVREQIIADGRFLAARNTFSGDFTSSPIGPVEPTGQHVDWEVINTFRYDDDGRLAEEWVQTDHRSFLTKLGVTATESAERPANSGQLQEWDARGAGRPFGALFLTGFDNVKDVTRYRGSVAHLWTITDPGANPLRHLS